MSYSSRIKKTIDGATQEQHLVFEHLTDAIEHAKTTGYEVNIYNNNNDQLVYTEPAPVVEVAPAPATAPAPKAKPATKAAPVVDSTEELISTDKVATSK